MVSWIYVIEAVGQHLFKVGLTTTSPENRLRQLKTGSPHKLSILTAFTCNEPERVEAAFHRFLESYSGAQRTQGEWFSLTRESMLEIMVAFFGKLAQGGGLSIRVPEPFDESESLLRLIRSCRIKRRTSLNLDEIRRRALRATEGRSGGPEKYSVFEVTESANVGDIGSNMYGYIDVPFDALAIGGPTGREYNDHVLALVPKIHGDAEANSELFANARSDILMLLSEVDRLTHEDDA